MEEHAPPCNHNAWDVVLRKWCYSDEKVKATLQSREPEWLDTLKCRVCGKTDVQMHNPDLPRPKA